MIAICRTEKEINFTYEEGYLIYGCKCLIDKQNERKVITEILTQDNNGSLVYVSADSFLIPDIDFSKYRFINTEFFYKSIAYEEFLTYYHEDRIDKIKFYEQAQKDFLEAKSELYEELSDDMLERRLINLDQDERDFIFDFLRLKNNDKFIMWAIKRIKTAMDENRKWYEIEKAFEYLTSFKDERVMKFFTEYLSMDYWENDIINNLIYDYFAVLEYDWMEQ